MSLRVRRLLVAVAILVLILTTSEGLRLSNGAATPRQPENQGMPAGTTDPEYTVEKWVPGQTWNGTTIFGNSATGEIDEVNMQGNLVWSYKIPYSGSIAPIVTGVTVLPGSNDVLYSVLDPESMRGAYEVNRQGQMVWSYTNLTTAHDAVRLPNGDTLMTATHAEDFGTWPYTYPEVFEVNSAGAVVWQWHAKNDFANNSYYANVRSKDFGPWTHTNEALRLPNGNTLISLRNFNISIAVDPAGKVLQSFGDPCSGRGCAPSLVFDYPDSPYPLSNGDYLVADGISGTVVEYSPSQQKIVWQWPATSGVPTGLLVLGEQRLPNGDTMVVDGHGQIQEVTQAGVVVWSLKCSCYNSSPFVPIIAFFRAERTSYMPPGFAIQSPKNGTAYGGGTVPLSITAGLDLGNVTYSLRNDASGTWVVKNATLLQNVYANALASPTVVHGPSSLNLSAGTYTLRVLAGSTGWGYKSFVQQKRINYAERDVVFTVNAATTTSSTISATSSTTPTSTTTAVVSASSTTSTAPSTTSSTTTPPVQTTTSTQTGSPVQTQTTASSSTTGGGGIPEFPFQLLAASAFTLVLVASYVLLGRRGTSGRAQSGSVASVS